MQENSGTSQSPWFMAIRPKTLPAAAAPVITGSALAFAHNSCDGLITIACLLSALLLQIGSNLANDVYDYEKGADVGERLGPTRVTQAGLLRPNQVKAGMWFVFGITSLLGIFLILKGGWPILVLGVAAIFSAIAYTGGPYPLGYHGWGDLFVFIFFGLGATVGTFYVQTGTVVPYVWWMAAAMGSLTVSILVVNNLRDIENDRIVGKRTLAVRFGIRGAHLEYFLMMIFAYSVPLITWVTGLASSWGLMTWLSIPLAIRWSLFITHRSGKALNNALAGTGQNELIYAILFALGTCLAVLTNYA
jgi:1,4-dihydroxy-2-naphthoate octaprenyltransferase